ncbi:MAG: DUF2244 domain-containing protein [Pseudomonadota bacterium]
MTVTATALPFLDVQLTPNAPLGRHGQAVVIGVVGVVASTLGAAFAVVGAWPVTGFLGLDVLLLWLALKTTARRARRSEVIRLDDDGLVIRRLGADGHAAAEVRLEPFWARVILDERRRHDPLLALRSHGRTVPIGAFLNAAERRELAVALEAALRHYRADRWSAGGRSPSTSAMP